MISVCMVAHDTQENVARSIMSATSPVVTDVILVDQDSSESWKDFATVYHHTTRKGWGDPDKQWCYEMATTPWVLALESDETLSPELRDALPDLIQEPVDIIWIKFRNVCDGVDLVSLLGDDYHPRLFKKGTLQHGMTAHQYPQATSGRQLFCDLPILHTRTFEKIKQSHAIRSPLLPPQEQQLEQQFLVNLDRLMTMATSSYGSHTD